MPLEHNKVLEQQTFHKIPVNLMGSDHFKTYSYSFFQKKKIFKMLENMH